MGVFRHPAGYGVMAIGAYVTTIRSMSVRQGHHLNCGSRGVAHEVVQKRPPQDVVYGLWREEAFAILGADWAAAAAAEIYRWEQASTVGEARSLRLRVVGAALTRSPVSP